MNKICVYTCITGEYDNLKEIELEKEIDYYCFTNNKKIKSNSWNVIYIEDNNISNLELARKIKILGHEIINNYDILLWMDGAVRFNKKIKDFINYYLRPDDCFVAFKHGTRDNIYDEMAACVRVGKESVSNVKKLIQFYKKENYNYDNGLIESTVFIKKPKEQKVIDTMNLWYYMISKYSKRDQLSFNYSISKTNLKVKWINKKVFDNEWFTWVNHNNDSKDLEQYRIYFDDEKNDGFNFDNNFFKRFRKNNNSYIAQIKVPCTCNKITVDLSATRFVKIESILLNDKKPKNIRFYNAFVINNQIYFYNQNCIFEIYKKINKNEKLKIEINMIKMNNNDIQQLFLNLKNEIYESKSKVDKLTADNNCLKNDVLALNQEIKKITNSKAYLFAAKIRKLVNFLRK